MPEVWGQLGRPDDPNPVSGRDSTGATARDPIQRPDGPVRAARVAVPGAPRRADTGCAGRGSGADRSPGVGIRDGVQARARGAPPQGRARPGRSARVVSRAGHASPGEAAAGGQGGADLPDAALDAAGGATGQRGRDRLESDRAERLALGVHQRGADGLHRRSPALPRGGRAGSWQGVRRDSELRLFSGVRHAAVPPSQMHRPPAAPLCRGPGGQERGGGVEPAGGATAARGDDPAGTAGAVGDARHRQACQRLEATLDRLLAAEQTDPDNARLGKLLRKHRAQLVTFLYVEGLAPTNNVAEREIRPAVVVRGTSGAIGVTGGPKRTRSRPASSGRVRSRGATSWGQWRSCCASRGQSRCN